MTPGSSLRADAEHRARRREHRATLVVDAKCALGEGATWCARSGHLYWTDIEGARLWRFEPRARRPPRGLPSPPCGRPAGRTTSWAMPEALGSFALCANPHYLLLGLATHLAFFDLATGHMHRIVDVEPGLNTRVNDGRCDRQGRFVFGTKDEADAPRPIGGFYRLNRDLSLERLPLPAPAIANSIAFSPDGASMYYCDTLTREIRVCGYGVDGRIDNDRLFARLADVDGYPDGSTVDADGGLWNAQWGGSRIVRYDANGIETERVSVPARQPSCVAFGGARLGTLYVTTARVGLDAGTLAAERCSGGVFAATPARRGLPEVVFQGVWPSA